LVCRSVRAEVEYSGNLFSIAEFRPEASHAEEAGYVKRGQVTEINWSPALQTGFIGGRMCLLKTVDIIVGLLYYCV
jgi:hypothetical protein